LLTAVICPGQTTQVAGVRRAGRESQAGAAGTIGAAAAIAADAVAAAAVGIATYGAICGSDTPPGSGIAGLADGAWATGARAAADSTTAVVGHRATFTGTGLGDRIGPAPLLALFLSLALPSLGRDGIAAGMALPAPGFTLLRDEGREHPAERQSSDPPEQTAPGAGDPQRHDKTVEAASVHIGSRVASSIQPASAHAGQIGSVA
jgi:hypothetical protein